MNRKATLKNTGLLILFIFLQLLLIYVLATNLLHGEIAIFLNTIYIGLPICMLMSICCLITIVFLIKMLIQKNETRLPKAILATWIGCLGISLVFAIVLAYTSDVPKDHKLNFQEGFSPNKIISAEYKESSLVQVKHSAKRWWNVELFHSSLSENLENIKTVNLDDEMKLQYPNISTQYRVWYMTNIPLWLQKNADKVMDIAFYMEFDKFSWRDSSKIEKFEYEDVEFTLYHDSHIDLETDRVLLLAHYNDSYILLSLIFQDTTGNLQVNSNHILNQVVEFSKEQSEN